MKRLHLHAFLFWSHYDHVQLALDSQLETCCRDSISAFGCFRFSLVPNILLGAFFVGRNEEK